MATATVTVGELPRAQGRRAVVMRAGNVDAPTLTAGAFTIVTGFSNVRFFKVGFRAGPQVADTVFEFIATVSGGTITVTVNKMQVSATNTWGAAVTADLAAAVLDWMAYGS